MPPRTIIVIIGCCLLSTIGPRSISALKSISTVDELKQVRGILLNKEFYRSTGHNITLNENEKIVNKIIMDLKYAEIKRGHLHPDNWVTSNPLSEVLDSISKSELFEMIQSMPKGGILHAHDSALGSTEAFVKLTYIPDCWICVINEDNVDFAFSKEYPTRSCTNEWKHLETLRANGSFSDDFLLDKFSFRSRNFKTSRDVWKFFTKAFFNTDNLMEYKPNFENYVKAFLRECLDDGVQYLELRSGIPELFDLDGNTGSKEETLELIQNVLEEFKRENPDFIDMKIIYAKNRKKSISKTKQFLQEALMLSKKYPIIIGFDLVNQEDEGYSLLEHAPNLLNKEIDYYFHAGETNWYGTTVDENLIDAVLLGAKRIGHGYALIKHPDIKEMVKKNDICIEVSPISNKMLKYVSDLRNHPVASFIAEDIPFVIASDDPSFFSTQPLSHDFYMTFVGISSAHSDLRFLKQLALNSIKYSGLYDKEAALKKWEMQWNRWIQIIVDQNFPKIVSPFIVPINDV